jgi:hypothetical protein
VSSVNGERVEVNLQLRSRFDATGTLGPYRILQTSGSSGYGANGCSVYVEIVRQAAVTPGKSEIVRFASFGKAAYHDQCARAQKLAAAAVGKLPAPLA